MGESLNQPSRVKEEGAKRRKLLLSRDKTGDASPAEGT